MASDVLRYERKLVCRASAAFAVLRLRLHAAGFSIVHPPRHVHSLYLDTSDLRLFRESGDGDYARTKIRFRWYGEQRQQAAQVVLERKGKQGLLVYKDLFPLPDMAPSSLLDARHRRRAVEGSAPEDLSDGLRWLIPTAYVGYRRHYLLSADRRFRATVDEDLCFADARLPTGSPTKVAGPVVVELKYAPEDDEDIGSITQTLPFRLARHSKYVRAVERTSANGHGLRL